MKMKKLFAMLMMAGAVAVAATSCSDDEDSDFEKGKKDGKAVCDCLRKATTEDDMAACYAMVDEAKSESNKDYARGADEGFKGCFDDIEKSDIVGNYSGDIDVSLGTGEMPFDSTGWKIEATASADTFLVTTDTLNVSMGPVSIPLVISLKVSNVEVVVNTIMFTIPAQTSTTAVGLLSITAGAGVYVPTTKKMTVDANGTMNMGLATDFTVKLEGTQK